MVRQRGGDGSTARLNAGPAVTNNTIDGSKPAVINNDYHQRGPKPLVKGGLELLVMNFLL